MKLEKHEVILDRDRTRSDSNRVTFGSATGGAATVELPIARCFDMDRPSQIKVTIEPVEFGPVCTCGPGRGGVAHHFGWEPHFVGCPRWGIPLAW